MSITKPICLLVVLVACGVSTFAEAPEWAGGVVGTWHPTKPHRAHVILHQGHDSFQAIEHIAEALAANGYTVHGVEMPRLPHDGRPLTDFTGPVLDLLDELGPVYMIGLSGGGWTTTVITSSDPRIIKGWSVAGDAPRDVWQGYRDWEQIQVPDYRALYAAAGDRLSHVYILNDPCCFDGITGDIGYPYLSDRSTTRHEISAWTLAHILAELP